MKVLSWTFLSLVGLYLLAPFLMELMFTTLGKKSLIGLMFLGIIAKYFIPCAVTAAVVYLVVRKK